MPREENVATYRKRREEEKRAKVKVKVKPKPKAPPIPVPSLTIQYEAPPARPKPRPTRIAVGPEPKPKRPPHGGHLPTEFEYLSPEQYLARSLGVETAAEKRQAKRQNQWRERKRRDAAALAKSAEKAARAQRREAVRGIPRDAREMLGADKLKRFIETGEGLQPSLMDAIGGALEGYASSLVRDPLRPARDIYSAADWWINRAPEAALGTHEKGKGYQGGLAETWDNMSTQEQIDTIVGGKSLANVLQGQGLNPANIGRAIALAALAPIPWGRGLPSLASVIMRAGYSAKEAEAMLRTGKGLAEALRATQQPVRPIARAKAALKGRGVKAAVPRVSALTHPIAADAEVIATWKPDAARIGKDALARAEHMPVVALRDAAGSLRSVAAYELQGDMLVIREIAGAGKGGGRAMMQELAREASSQNKGIRLIAETEEAAGFYRRLGMKPLGKKGFVWEPEEAAAFARRGEPLAGLPPKGQTDAGLRDLADEYTTAAGIPHARPTQYATADPQRGSRIAAEYDRMPDAAKGEGTPEYQQAVMDSYRAFAEETAAQYDTLLARGYQFEFMPVGQDPYGGSPWGAMRDLQENKHMYVFPTDEGFGTLEQAGAHPLLRQTGLTWKQTLPDGSVVDKPVTENDLFRAVHDVFGHKKEGVGFRADGEENAWRSHVAMYSDRAKPAMTAETRGQNSWVNFGPHGAANQTANQADTVYADQKAGIMAPWTWQEGAGDEAAASVQGQLLEVPEELPIPIVYRFTREEAESLPSRAPGIWYHGTTAANADEIERTGVLKVGERSEPAGAWLTSNPLHAAQFGDTVIMIPEAMIPAEAERISAFGGMVSSPVDIPLVLRETAENAAPPPATISPAARSVADEIQATDLPLPPELADPEDLARAIEDVFALAREGESGKDWYKVAAAEVMRVAEHLDLPPIQVAQLFAIFSQAADTVSNATFVFDAARQFQKWDDLFSGRFPVAQSPEALAVLKGGKWEGRKRSSFYANMLRHIPGMEDEYAMVIKAMAESRGAPINHPVTVDRWVVRMFRPNAKKDVPEKFYDTFETIMQRMAAQLGWEPEQIQAAAWVATKTRALEKELAKKGRQTVRHIAGGGDAFTHGVNRQIELEAQGALFKGLETSPQARRLANQVNKKWGGFTVNRDLTPVPETGYSVTYSLTEETYPLHKIKASDIEQFKERYKNLLRDSRNKIGGFSDDQNAVGDGTDVSYLSVTRHFPSDSPQSKAAALRFAREQGQETVYEYKTGDGIRTGLSRDEQREIIRGLDPASTRGGPVQAPPPAAAEVEYRKYLDDIVRDSGKGKKGVTENQRAEAERQMQQYVDQYPDDPESARFLQLYDAARADDVETEIPWGEPEAGFFDFGGFRGDAPIRKLRYNEKEAQLLAARSGFTRTFIERPADWTSAKLANEESRAARMVNRVLPTASAKARVAKAAGRAQIQEAARAQARMLNHMHDLPDMGSRADIAHFYWAQLPSDLRNVEGLRLVRERQAKELQEIVSGRALRDVEAQIGAVKAQLAETEDLSLLGELEDLRVLATDLDFRAEDLSKSLARLDKLIAKPPKFEPKVIDAMRALSEERRRVLIRAGALDPGRAAEREGLLSRFIGVPPSGEEVYVGHRIGKVKGAQSQLMPVAPGLGKPRLPQGARQKNRLVLARTGRLRPTTHVTAEDWQAAQTYEAALVARDDLAAMGKPYNGGRLPEGHVLVNPKGKVVPAHWKSDHLTQIGEMGDEEIRAAADDLMSTFIADKSKYEQMVEEAKAAGIKLDDLRVVREDVVKRYYGQFLPVAKGTKGGRAYDAAVDFAAASIVFARVGYIPKNIAQNLIMSMPHQGPFMLVNIPRAAEALTDPKLRHLLHAEVGFSGAAHGIGQELRYGQKVRGIPGKAAGFVGKIADDPARFAAFVHEAAAAGVIPKYKPHLSQADKDALFRLLTDKGQRPLLNDIRGRAVESMADFSRLTPTQRRWARRFLIIPGWLWAGSRYPFHFAASHPGRSLALAYVLAGEPYGDKIGLPQNPPVTDLFAEGLPQFIEGIQIPDSFPIFGGDVFRTTSLSPVSTPYDIALALAGQSPDTAASYANPLAKSLYNIAQRRVEYPGGSYQAGYQESILRNLERILPNWTFVKQETYDVGGAAGRYPEDESRLGRFFRELGVVPIQIRNEEQQETDAWQEEVETLSGQPMPDSVKGWRKAYLAYTKTVREFEDATGVSTSYNPQARLAALELTVGALVPERKAEAKARADAAFSLDDDAAEEKISMIREKLGLTAYDRLQRKIGEARANAQSHTGMRNAGQH